MEHRSEGTATWGLIDSPVGALLTVVRDGVVLEVSYHRGEERSGVPGAERDDAACSFVRDQLDEYFAGERTAFDLDLEPHGTEFQLQVWGALASIPYGETASYGDIARAVGRPRAVRAVGGANNANPISIIVPCHRVIGSDGSLTGYGGGLEVKRALLALERGGSGPPRRVRSAT